MAGTRKPGPGAEASPPAFYTATADLMVGEEGGGMPVAAYRAGDMVPAVSVESHPEWVSLVYDPSDGKGRVRYSPITPGTPSAPVEAPPGTVPAEEPPATAADDTSTAAAAGKDGT